MSELNTILKSVLTVLRLIKGGLSIHFQTIWKSKVCSAGACLRQWTGQQPSTKATPGLPLPFLCSPEMGKHCAHPEKQGMLGRHLSALVGI